MNSSSRSKLLRAVIGCLAVQLCVGILYLWSVCKQSAISHFGWDAGAVNLVASFMLLAFCLGSLVGGLSSGHYPDILYLSATLLWP